MAGSFQSVSIQSIRSPSRQRFPGSGWTARHSLVTPGHSGPIRTAVSWLWMDWPAVLSSSQEFFQSHRVLKSFPAQPPHIARNSPSRQEQHKRGIIHPFSKAFLSHPQCLRPPVIGAEAGFGCCPLRSGQEGLKRRALKREHIAMICSR